MQVLLLLQSDASVRTVLDQRCTYVYAYPLTLAAWFSPVLSRRRPRVSLSTLMYAGDLDGTGSLIPVAEATLSITCACSPTPTPSVAPPPAPATVDDSVGGSSSVPLWAVIVGSVAGAVLLGAVGLFAVKRSRDEKNGNSFGASPPGPTGHHASGAGASAAGRTDDTAPPPLPKYSEPFPPQ